MTALADVFIQGRVDTSRFGSDIRSGMNSPATRGNVDAAAKQSGGRMGGAFSRALKVASGAAIAYVGAGAIKQSINLEAQFSKTMNVLQATTGATGKQMSSLSDLAMKMGADTVFSANDASKAMLELARGGMTAATIQGGALKGTLTLAAAGELEMGEAANIAVKSMGQFNLSGKDMDGVAAALAGSANASSASVRDMSIALAQGGLAANSVGFSLQEATAVLASFSNAGLEGSDAGTSMKTMLDRLQPTTESAKTAMMMLGGWTSETGSAFIKANGEFKSAAQIAEILHKGTEKLGEAERKRLITQAFGSDAQRAATILAKEGAKGIDAMVKATSDQSAAQKMAAANMKGTSGALERLKGSAETAQLTLGRALAPTVQKVAGALSEKAIPAVTKFITGMTDGTGAGGKFAGVLKTTASFIKRNSDWLVPLVGALATGAVVFRTVTAVTRAWAAAQVILNVALTANPIGLVIAAIAALVVGLVIAWKKSETFRRVVTAAFGEVKKNVQIAALYVADKVLWMAEKMLGAMEFAFSWVPGLGDKLKKASGAIKAFREDVNREMDAIRDEDVNVTVKGYSIISKQGQVGPNGLPLGGPRADTGGRGPIPRAAMMRAAGGGGNGLVVKAQTSGASRTIDKAATDIQGSARSLAVSMAKQAQERQRKAAAAVGKMGAAGPAGHILPPGSYSIGMPYHGYPGHNGADYPAPTGTPVYAPWAGRVTASYDLPGSNPYNSTPYRSYGRVVQIAYANGMTSLFAHLSQRIGHLGPVKAGAMVGRVGMNGNATGPHLHAEFNGGRTNPASLGIFDRGGIMRGLGINLSGQPERVLSPHQTKLHDRQTAALEAMAAGGGGRVDFTITNWERGTGYFEKVADGRVKAHRNHTRQMKDMGGRQ